MVDVFLSNIIEEAEVKALLNSKYILLEIDEDGWYNYESGNMGIYFVPASKNYGDGNEIIYYDKKALWDSGFGTKVKRKYRSKKRN